MIEKKFGEHFQWGGGFAANQMEGAYLEGGKVYVLRISMNF